MKQNNDNNVQNIMNSRHGNCNELNNGRGWNQNPFVLSNC